MDDGNDRSQRSGPPGREPGGANRARPQANSRPPGNPSGPPPGGGLLSRYGGRPAADEEGLRGAWQALTGQARRLGDNLRRATGGERSPRAGEWKATDFDSGTLEDWDRHDAAPFDLPPDPDASAYERDRERGRGRSGNAREYSAERPARQARGRGGQGDGGSPRDDRQWRGWDDRADGWREDEWKGWETGTWDTGWATGYQPSMEYARAGATGEYDSGFWAPGRTDGYHDDNEDALSRSLGTLAQLSVVGTPIGRLARVRLLLRRRPAAAAMLAFFLLGFMLTCFAPAIPLLRLGYDAADAARRVSKLQAIFAGGSAALFNGTNLKDAQAEVDGITHDLYEINGAMNIAGAPLAAVSPAMKNYRLLVRMGFDLTSSADEGLNVAQTLLTPIEGGAISSDSSTPGLTSDDIQQARAVLSDATVRLQDAITAYSALDVAALPAQLKPGSKYGNLLGLLPTAQSALGEMSRLLDVMPDLLGIGKPAYYLVVAMDRSELRPGGGFQGNWGILELDGGKQSKARPLALRDVYVLDQMYFKSVHGNTPGCRSYLPQPPQYYWWWPYDHDDTCTVDWGLRDSNLSPDFPTNARTAMSITEQAGQVPDGAPLQGVIAFTPVLIADLLAATGSLPMPDWGVTVTAQNLEQVIHDYQLGVRKPPNGADRKEFTHQLSSRLLKRLQGLHGSALKPVLQIAQTALKDKDLQIYFAPPRAQLVLEQLGLASEIRTGEGDGYFVVDTNFGGNKANTYVTERQTDYVTLLPDGGALHRLQIAVTYDKKGSVYELPGEPKDYIELQRTYLPSDATILGYSGFTPTVIGKGCSVNVASIVSDCSSSRRITGPSTLSDIPGRSMVMGPLMVMCGPTQDIHQWVKRVDALACDNDPQVHTQTIYIEWYTPHAFALDAKGHGTYSEVIERQPGSVAFATVYVDTSQLRTGQPNLGDYIFSNGDADTAFSALISGKKPALKTQPLDSNTTVSVHF